MKKIKINIVDWWDEDFEKNYFIQFLSRRYDIEQSSDPDYILCSVFGDDKFFEYDCIRIFFTGENIVPDFNLYDYCMGFHYLNFEDRYLRYPLFLTYEKALSKAVKKHILPPPLRNKSIPA